MFARLRNGRAAFWQEFRRDPHRVPDGCTLAELAESVCAYQAGEGCDGPIDETESAARKREVEKRRGSFQVRHGRIIDEYYGCTADVAALLTDRDELWIDTARSSAIARCPEVDEQIHQIYRSRVKAYQVLKSTEMRISIQELFSVSRQLLATLDWWCNKDRNGSPKEKAAAEGRLCVAAETARSQLGSILDDQADMAQRQTQRRYVAALLTTAFFLVLVPVGVLLLGYESMAISSDGAGFKDAAWGPLWLCAAAGAVGTAVSLVLRMGNGGLGLDGLSSRWQAVVLGSGRAWLGVIFGVVLIALIESGLLPIDLPASDPDEVETLSDLGQTVFFVAILGFLAGFSERLVPDALAVSAGRVLAKNKGDTAGESASAAKGRHAAEVYRRGTAAPHDHRGDAGPSPTADTEAGALNGKHSAETEAARSAAAGH